MDPSKDVSGKQIRDALETLERRNRSGDWLQDLKSSGILTDLMEVDKPWDEIDGWTRDAVRTALRLPQITLKPEVWMTVTLGEYQSLGEYRAALKAMGRGDCILATALSALESIPIATESTPCDLMLVGSTRLGCRGMSQRSYAEVLERAVRLGLRPCRPEVALALMTHKNYTGPIYQEPSHTIASEPLSNSLFMIMYRHMSGEIWFQDLKYNASWGPGRYLIFELPRAEEKPVAA
ncbi:MAG: hypothetical protein AAB608_00145 [Patescibacteria group bacterium]